MWWKTKLVVYYNIYKDSICAFNMELGKARQTFFLNIINSNLNNTRTLFTTVERLTNTPSQIPREMLSESKCSEFASFFSEKINNIRKVISTFLCCSGLRQIRPQPEKVVAMPVFEKILGKILGGGKIYSTLKYQPAPLTYFPHLGSNLEADPLEVENASLLSESFSNSLKTAVVKPLLS